MVMVKITKVTLKIEQKICEIKTNVNKDFANSIARISYNAKYIFSSLVFK